MKAELFRRDDLTRLSWPEHQDGDYARRYLTPMMRNGAEKYIRNVHNTQIMIGQSGGMVLPITVSDFDAENSYTCSPYSHYIAYGGFEEVHRLGKPAVEALIQQALKPVAWYFRRSQFDRVALVNNWLVSTNLYPAMRREEVEALIDRLPGWFEDRPIVFRSVDSYSNPMLFEMLRAKGYEMVFSRQIWFQQPPESVRTRQFREDARRVRRNGHTMSERFSTEDAQRAVELYGLLYLKKYSMFNPQFTEAFLQLARGEGLLEIRTARDTRAINGILGYFTRNGIMTCPLFGYDTGLARDTGLYRMLSVAAMKEALKNGWLLHASAGVGRFKKLRGGTAVIEYNAVYTGHLPRQRRWPWKVIQAIGNASIPIIRRNEF